jgi:predicted flap endonuclease-1-like 5' DNA nuclease
MFGKRTFWIGLLVISPALVAFSYSSQTQASARQWFWALLILIAALLLVWWWLRQDAGEDVSRRSETDMAVPSSVVEAPAEATPPPAPAVVEPAVPDDLKRIEGIGPKISGLLQEAGITTFAQLAATDIERLEQIVDEAGLLSIANPSTWPEQAALAAAGKWNELEALQDALKGGRRV